MRFTARSVISTRSSCLSTESFYEYRIVADDVDSIAREMLEIRCLKLALANLLVEPIASDPQFLGQAWDGPAVIDHRGFPMLMQWAGQTCSPPEFVNGAHGDC